MDYTFIYSFVYKRNGRIEQLAAGVLIVPGDRRSKLLYLGAKPAPIAAVDLIPLDVLSNSLFSRFMICHC
jgi:hypothetical protein